MSQRRVVLLPSTKTWGATRLRSFLGVLKQLSPFLLHDDHDVLARVEHLFEERGFEVQGIGRDHVDQPGVLAQDALEEPSCRGDFSLPGTDEFEVQDGGGRDADPLRDHDAVVVLEFGSGGFLDLPHQALRAAAGTRGADLVAIHRHHPIRLARPRVNGLAAPRVVQDCRENLASLLCRQAREHATDGVGARLASPDPRIPSPRQAKLLLEGVEAAQAQHVHPEDREPDGRGRDLGQEPTVVQTCDQSAQAEASLDIGGEAPEQGYLSRFSSRSRNPSEICSSSCRTSE